MRVSNTSGARQGVHTTTGLVWLKPGETRDDLALSHSDAERAGRLPFLLLSGDPVDAPLAEGRPSDLSESVTVSRDDMEQMRLRVGNMTTEIERLTADLRAARDKNDGLTKQLEAARAEVAALQKQPATPVKLEAKHRGGGSYSVLDAEGKEVLEKLSKADAEAFNAMTAEEQAEYVKASTKA